MTIRYESKRFALELDKHGVSIDCLSRFMACQVLLSRSSSIEEVPFALTQKIKISIYDMIQADSISEEVFFAITDLYERIQQIVDTQIGIFDKKEISAFKGLNFSTDDEYELAGSPYRAEFTRSVFNMIQKKVQQELILRGVATSFINFELKSYLDFLSEKGLSIKQMDKRNESLIFEWSEYAAYLKEMV